MINPNLITPIKDMIGGFLKSSSFWFAAVAFLLLAGSATASLFLWSWLHPEAPTEVSNSETLSNIGLLIAGGLAFVFAGWCAWVAERQTVASQHQVDIAQQSLLNERYQKGAEMLGSEVLSVRLGGIYALQRLAEERPDEYHIQIMRLFCAFVRLPTRDQILDSGQAIIEPGTLLETRQDVEAVMQMIGSRAKSRIALERRPDFRLDLRGADLPNTQFLGADLSNAMFHYSNLSGANFADTDLTNAFLFYSDLSQALFHNVTFTRTRFWVANLSGGMLQDADLSRTDFRNANLSDANLIRANLSGAIFQDAKASNAWFEGANMSLAFFLGADLSGARLVMADMSGALF